MRILVLSDIHSNLQALEACLAHAPAHDVVVNLGDIVGYGANPNEVIERARGLGTYFVRGNHDKAAAGLMDLNDFNPIAGMAALWTREHLTPANLQWLTQLPQGPIQVKEFAQAQFVHGSPIDEDEYLVTPEDALESLLASERPLTFFGHSHLQCAFTTDRQHDGPLRPAYKTVGQAESAEWQLKKDMHYLINPGSVGQPRDGDWRAGFALFDSDTYTLNYYRVPYDLKAAQQRIMAAKLPPRLATRLATGR
ncbi:MAG TPA: metallophosphoesterase family protein [Terriglobales bacterium]|nr:metallophosphoesterase family protein [Terriglobales bacterium]